MSSSRRPPGRLSAGPGYPAPQFLRHAARSAPALGVRTGVGDPPGAGPRKKFPETGSPPADLRLRACRPGTMHAVAGGSRALGSATRRTSGEPEPPGEERTRKATATEASVVPGAAGQGEGRDPRRPSGRAIKARETPASARDAAIDPPRVPPSSQGVVAPTSAAGPDRGRRPVRRRTSPSPGDGRSRCSRPERPDGQGRPIAPLPGSRPRYRAGGRASRTVAPCASLRSSTAKASVSGTPSPECAT